MGDSVGASIVAIDTGDKGGKKASPAEIKGIDAKIAALLGTVPDQILINDAVVNPKSGNVYISVSRGRGPDATAVIVRADGAGKLEALSLDNIGHAKSAIPDAPAAGAKDSRGRDLRVESITDIEFVDGQADRRRPVERGVLLQVALDRLSVRKSRSRYQRRNLSRRPRPR